MSPIAPTAFYNDLSLSFEHAWALLAEGAARRQSPLHTLVVATADASGQPDARVMVLREVDRGQHKLRFHTDVRADKVALIATGARVAVLAYHPAEKIQLRLQGYAHIDRSSPEHRAAWEQTLPFGRRCYLGAEGPGQPTAYPTSGLPADVEGLEPDLARTAPGFAHFALLLVELDQFEWLYLANAGHRRARFIRTDTVWSGQWLVP